jgi:U3 small nucleolar RNA-associated protein 21
MDNVRSRMEREGHASPDSQEALNRASVLYAPFKSVGFVTDGNPFLINRLGEENFLVTSVGAAFQVYRVDKLNVCMVSGQVPGGPIRCFYAHGHDTFVGVGSSVIVFNRTKLVREYALGEQPVVGMCGVGSILLVWDEANTITVRDMCLYDVCSRILFANLLFVYRLSM